MFTVDPAALEDITDWTCRLLCHLAVVHGINSLAVGMRQLLLLQPVHLSSVAWWLFWGFHGHALHHREGEGAHIGRLWPLHDMGTLWKCCNLQPFFTVDWASRTKETLFVGEEEPEGDVEYFRFWWFGL